MQSLRESPRAMRAALGTTAPAALLGACSDTCGASRANPDMPTPQGPECGVPREAIDAETAVSTSVSLDATEALDVGDAMQSCRRWKPSRAREAALRLPLS